MTAGELAGQFELSWPTMSGHFGVQREANLVQSDRAGSTVTFTSGVASFSGGGKIASLGGNAVVPEPGTLGLLLVGAVGVLNRRRRPG